MLNKTKRVLAVLLAAALVFSLVGCSKAENDGSSVIVQEEIVYEYEDSSSNGETATSGNQGGNQQGTTSSGSGGGSSTITATGVNPADYKGTKIIFATTVDPKVEGTDYVISNFEKEYGIEVEVSVAESLQTYANKMSNLILAGKAPTVGRSNGDCPLYLSYFQSLDAAKIDYKDEIWNQNTFKYSTYNGSPYLCDTVGNYFTEVDIVAYSKSLLKRAQCSTPEEYDAAGNWTFDAFLEIGRKTAAKAGCKGASMHGYDCLLNMAGGSVYRLDANNRLVNGIDNTTTAVFQKIAQGFKDGYIDNGNTEGLMDGTIAITTTHAWALRKDGALAKHPNWNDVGFYYMPAFEKGGDKVATGLFRGWGIMKGCNENPETGSKAAVAGGLFLREYLDVSNYDLKDVFISEDAKTFFFKVCDFYATSNNYNPYLTTYDLNAGISGVNTFEEVYKAAMRVDPAAVPTVMNQVKSKVQYGTDNLNKKIEEWLAAK